ncbi:hypothetical protein Tco_1124673 [Tanacetum coccineum]|uniref:Uncharacterized protein n=1 Tax=Tanacetum coccineum TaxID=301880 RepID=A0ABQ5J6W3_9ASTR
MKSPSLKRSERGGKKKKMIGSEAGVGIATEVTQSLTNFKDMASIDQLGELIPSLKHFNQRTCRPQKGTPEK